MSYHYLQRIAPMSTRLDLSKGISSNSPFSVSLFLPGHIYSAADSHASAFSSNNILHLHASLYPIFKLCPLSWTTAVAISTTASHRACPLITFHIRDQRAAVTHLWPLLAPPIRPWPPLFSKRKTCLPSHLGAPPGVPHPLLAAIPLPARLPWPREMVASPLLTVPPGAWRGSFRGPGPPQAPSSKASPNHPGGLPPAAARTPWEEDSCVDFISA